MKLRKIIAPGCAVRGLERSTTYATPDGCFEIYKIRGIETTWQIAARGGITVPHWRSAYFNAATLRECREELADVYESEAESKREPRP